MIKLPGGITSTVMEVVSPVDPIFREAQVHKRGGPVVRRTEKYGTFS